MDNTYRLIEIFTGYVGCCDACGAENTADFLLVSPYYTDKDGNHLYQVLGELENGNSYYGTKFYCQSCNAMITVVRCYKTLDVTKEFEWITK